MKAKELVFSEFPVISWARKKSHLACNHEAHTRYALRMTNRRFIESGSPADACCAIWLSFRALGRLS
ncbi:MAG: hypothetical protein AMJ94_02130 [Deltaproteobacteria bacterium SM23_61]|nr:MAG: hypothetical protein AMJ94_02130 [Deltaproteobacteria bacterium SM23_61]